METYKTHLIQTGCTLFVVALLSYLFHRRVSRLEVSVETTNQALLKQGMVLEMLMKERQLTFNPSPPQKDKFATESMKMKMNCEGDTCVLQPEGETEEETETESETESEEEDDSNLDEELDEILEDEE